jgi:hypothetical protein
MKKPAGNPDFPLADLAGSVNKGEFQTAGNSGETH